MSIIDRLSLKNLFKTARTPSQNDYWNWFDSYVHKNDKISTDQVTGLSDALAAKLDTEASDNILKAVQDNSTTMQALKDQTYIQWKETTTWYDGSAIDDSKVDNILFKKVGDKYFQKQLSGLDIRDFGIVNNPGLDQSRNLDALALYCDFHNVYEIDFLGFSLMTSQSQTYLRSDGLFFRGLRFKKVHKIKNLTICHNKSAQLKSFHNLISFIPEVDAGGLPIGQAGTFALENVVFDAYIADFHLSTQAWDGACLGFMAWYGQNNAPELNKPTQFDFIMNNVKFLSPAISYNIYLSMWFDTVSIRDVQGEYWGLFFSGMQNVLDIDGLHGIFRQDYHAASGRTLVTNLIHNEVEIANPPETIVQESVSIKNTTCYTNTGNLWQVYKYDAMFPNTFRNLYFENIEGDVFLHSFKNEAQPGYATFNTVVFRNCLKTSFLPQVQIDDLYVYNSNVLKGSIVNTSNPTIKNLNVYDSEVLNIANTYVTGALVVENLLLNNCRISPLSAADISSNGIINQTTASIYNATLINCQINSSILFKCQLGDIRIINCVYVYAGAVYDFIVNAAGEATISFINTTINTTTTPWTNFIGAINGGKIKLSLISSYMANKADIDLSSVSILKDFASTKIPAVLDTATQAAGTNPTQAEFNSLLSELRDLKSKMTSAGYLTKITT